MKKVRYHDILRNDVRKFVSISGCETLNGMISRAQEREIDFEHIRKKGPDQVHILEGPGRDPRFRISF